MAQKLNPRWRAFLKAKGIRRRQAPRGRALNALYMCWIENALAFAASADRGVSGKWPHRMVYDQKQFTDACWAFAVSNPNQEQAA